MKTRKRTKKGAKHRRRSRAGYSLAQIGVGIGAILLLLLIIAYSVGFFYYGSHFLKGTTLNGTDVSGLSLKKLEKNLGMHEVELVQRGRNNKPLPGEVIRGEEIELRMADSRPLKALLSSQKRGGWLWKKGEALEADGFLTYDAAKLEKALQRLEGFEKGAPKPSDARIEREEDGSYRIVPEEYGAVLVMEKTKAAVGETFARMEGKVDLDETKCYREPLVYKNNEALLDQLQLLKNVTSMEITYVFGDKREVLEGETIKGWISFSNEAGLSIDEEQVRTFVKSLHSKYDTVYTKRQFKTSYGKTVTVSQGDYGWWIDTDAETQNLCGYILSGESAEVTPAYRQKAASYGDADWGDTYAEVNLSSQHMFFYQNGKLVLESDCATGNPSKGNATPPGIYSITYKERDATLNGETYSTPVSYWMPFNLNVGFHDAPWQARFGGDWYKTNGSHGCVNLPVDVAKQLYSLIEKGMPVIVYELPGTEMVYLMKYDESGKIISAELMDIETYRARKAAGE